MKTFPAKKPLVKQNPMNPGIAVCVALLSSTHPPRHNYLKLHDYVNQLMQYILNMSQSPLVLE